ncbi:MAG: low molecular weight phosphotyrosine protein phosphatase [Bacteroidales bacterium]|nr:low molecular weight phosphotyrosine protein phosphatase [Bacteroidales bacterium]
MNRILFVCHGNICRSVTAEFVFKDLAARAGVAHLFEVDSAATSREEIGNPIYPMALRTLEIHGIHGAQHAARQVTCGDYHYYDHLILMDRENLRSIRHIIPDDPQGKISLLLDHTDATDRSHHERDVADPWYTRDFAAAWEDITVGCAALLRKLCGGRA